MKSRDVVLVSAAAGVAVGGLAWLVNRTLTAPGHIEPIHTGEAFPTITGSTLSGQVVTLPDDLAGRVGVLILADSYSARTQVEAWARHVVARYGEQPELAFFEIALISGVGPVMRRMIDAAMIRHIPADTQSHVLTVYGDLREFRRRMGLHGRPLAHVVVLGRTGRIAWQETGEPSEERLAALDAVLAAQGIAD